jgi:hypothetical protein
MSRVRVVACAGDQMRLSGVSNARRPTCQERDVIARVMKCVESSFRRDISV